MGINTIASEEDYDICRKPGKIFQSFLSIGSGSFMHGLLVSFGSLNPKLNLEWE
jgi:hypothetical protein